MNLAELEKRRAELGNLLTETEKKHKGEIAEIVADIIAVKTAIGNAVGGMDLGLIALAESVIYVKGSYEKAGEDRARCIQAAINDLADDRKNLKREYFGTKDYDRWHGQTSNHPYMMGPRHGYVIFEIGLQKGFRAPHGRDLTPEEATAAIYYLHNLEKIQKSRNTAVAETVGP